MSALAIVGAERPACGPKSIAALEAMPGYRKGRADVRRELALDLYASADMKAADHEMAVAHAIERGEE